MDFIISGLGNPGKQYENTRHNVGFMASGYMAKKLGVAVDKLKFRALCGKGKIGDKQVLIMQPQTLMNASGEAVAAAARYYRVPPEHIIVIHDDIALPAGKLRIRKTGSDGGHRGLKSITEQLSSESFIRIKLGVSDRENHDIPLADWVLGTFSESEKKLVEQKFDDIYNAILLIAEDKTELAMSRYNG